MNNSIFLMAILLAVTFTHVQAQEVSFGIKGGINYATGGELTGRSSGQGYNSDTFTAESKIGLHGGAFFEVRFGRFLIRPEAMYNTIESEFDFPVRRSVYSMEKISIPILLGYTIYGPLDIYAGPAYQNITSATLQGTEPADDEIIVQDSPIAAQAGIKAVFGRFEIDFRYDRTLSEAQSQVIDMDNSAYGVNLADFEDSRLHQFLLSLSFKLFSSEANSSRRRGGNCY